MALTFSMVKRAAAKELGLNVSDVTRIADALNEAQPRLLSEGKWKGTYQKYRFCVSDGCVTLPREVEGIEAFAVSGQPGTVRNQWFEFLESGPGLFEDDSCLGVQVVDRGLVCSFDNVLGVNKKLAVYSDEAEDAAAKIVLIFYNSAGQLVRSSQGGVMSDGEAITLPAQGTYAYTTNFCAPNGLVRVIKPITVGTIRLYEYDNITTLVRPLGYYAPTEQVPEYRKVLIPSLGSMGCGGCENVTVDIMAKLKHIPITGKDNDLLLIRSVGAIKLACKALQHESANGFEEAAIAWGAAKNVLDKELRAYLGDGVEQPVKTPSPEVWGAAVGNVI